MEKKIQMKGSMYKETKWLEVEEACINQVGRVVHQ